MQSRTSEGNKTGEAIILYTGYIAPGKLRRVQACFKNERFVIKRVAKKQLSFPPYLLYTMDNLTKKQRIKNMQANKSAGTKPERLLVKTLFARGHRYRKNNKTVFGKPDLTFKKIKLAIFVDGEFWHGKDWSERKHDHKTNKEFWHAKIERNMKRDQEVNTALTKQGWTILRF